MSFIMTYQCDGASTFLANVDNPKNVLTCLVSYHCILIFEAWKYQQA